MDFVADQTGTGDRFRALTIVDVFTRECLAVEPGQRLGGEDVVRVLSKLAAKRGAPGRIYCDNGSEFAGRLVDLWAYANKVTLEFSRPGKPTDNAYIESFNGSLRDECLNVHWFDDLTDANEKLQAWKRDYKRESASPIFQQPVAPAVQGPMGRTKVRKMLALWTREWGPFTTVTRYGPEAAGVATGRVNLAQRPATTQSIESLQRDSTRCVVL